MKGFSYVLGALLFSIVFSYGASAQTQLTNNEAQFFADNPGLAIQNFSAGKVSTGVFESCEVPIDENSDDDCFDPGVILPGIQFQNGPIPINFGLVLAGPNVLGNTNPVNVLIPETYLSDFEIVFPEGNVRAAALHAGCLLDDDGPCTSVYEVRVLGVGDVTLAATDLLATDQFDAFIGVTSSEVITKIVLTNITDLSFKGVRDVLFPVPVAADSIPTLSEWGMIAAGTGFALIGIFYAVRRRRAQA